jgi:hypothetical protein
MSQGAACGTAASTLVLAALIACGAAVSWNVLTVHAFGLNVASTQE